MSPNEIFALASKRETALSQLLMAYIGTGLVFMLLPGTFLGVWNLISISSHKAAEAISPAWIQAHGQAQIFGWIGRFILGIGFYLFSGLLVCGVRGYKLVIVSGDGKRGYKKYGCPSNRCRGTCSNDVCIRQDRLEDQLLSYIES